MVVNKVFFFLTFIFLRDNIYIEIIIGSDEVYNMSNPESRGHLWKIPTIGNIFSKIEYSNLKTLNMNFTNNQSQERSLVPNVTNPQNVESFKPNFIVFNYMLILLLVSNLSSAGIRGYTRRSLPYLRINIILILNYYLVETFNTAVNYYLVETFNTAVSIVVNSR